MDLIHGPPSKIKFYKKLGVVSPLRYQSKNIFSLTKKNSFLFQKTKKIFLDYKTVEAAFFQKISWCSSYLQTFVRKPQTFLCIKKKVHRKQFGDVPNNTMFSVKRFFQTK